MNLKFFKIAKILSLKSDHPKHKLGAVIVDKRGKILGRGFNLMKTHPHSNSYERRIHAEFSAILACKTPVKGCSIYVYRGLKDGSIGLSKPCKYCLEMLKAHGIKEMYFTTETGYKMESL
jgi:deoxycytidylate deaminase